MRMTRYIGKACPIIKSAHLKKYEGGKNCGK